MARGTLNRYLLILKRLIFESSVCAGMLSFAAAQVPRDLSLTFCSRGLNHFLFLPQENAQSFGSRQGVVPARLSRGSSTEKVSSSQRKPELQTGRQAIGQSRGAVSAS